jgi:hypothetical protein
MRTQGYLYCLNLRKTIRRTPVMRKTSQHWRAQAGKQAKESWTKKDENEPAKEAQSRAISSCWSDWLKSSNRKKRSKIEEGYEETPPSWWPIAARCIHLGLWPQRQHLKVKEDVMRDENILSLCLWLPDPTLFSFTNHKPHSPAYCNVFTLIP